MKYIGGPFKTSLKLIITCLVVCHGMATRGQEPTPTDASKVINNDTTEIGVYIDLAAYYFQDKNELYHTKAGIYLDKALNLARKTDNQKYLFTLLDKEGVRLRNKGKYKAALSMHIFVKNWINESYDPILLLRTLNNIGVVFRRLDDYQLATEYHMQALRIADSLGHKYSQAIALNSLGNITFLLKDYHKALEYFEQSLQIESQLGNIRGIAINLNNLGNVYLAIRDTRKARDYYQHSLEMNLQINNNKGIAICYNDLGNVNMADGLPDKALNYYQRALEIFDQTDDLRYVIDSKINIAKVVRARKEYAKAEMLLNEALVQANELGVLSQLRDIHLLISEIKTLAGQPLQALTYYKKAVKYSDSLLNETNQRNIVALQTRYQTEQKAREIDSLKQESQIRQLRQRKQQYIFIALTIILLIGVATAYYAYRTKRKQEKRLLEKNRIIEKAQKELNHYNKELEIAKDKAERLAEAKSEFLANMSHEIRTPLNAILGFTAIIARNPAAESTIPYLEAIRNNGKSLLRIINDILDLATIESGKIIITPSVVNLDHFINENLSTFAMIADQKQIFLTRLNRTHLPEWIEVDEQRLRQILFNLLGNALKFTERGKITLEMGTTAKSFQIGQPIDLSITVTDTGRGIAPQNLNIIFESFRQVQPANKPRLGGTGLGLTISRRLAQLMNGQISVQSIENEGSSFTLSLSGVKVASPEQIEAADINALPTNLQFEDSLILIVDDIADNRLLLSEFVRYDGIKTLEAANGDEAIQLAAIHSFDLLFLDMRMPGIDGYEVIRRIHAGNKHRNTPVIAVSASVFDTDRQRFIDAGFADFIAKPIQNEEVIRVLTTHLKLKNITGNDQS